MENKAEEILKDFFKGKGDFSDFFANAKNDVDHLENMITDAIRYNGKYLTNAEISLIFYQMFRRLQSVEKDNKALKEQLDKISERLP